MPRLVRRHARTKFAGTKSAKTKSAKTKFSSPIAALVFLVLLVASCSSDGFPESYTAQPQTLEDGTEVSLVELNWLDGCTVGLEQPDLAADANRVCQCSFDTLSADGGIPFEDFVALNNELKGDPESLANSEALTATEQQLLDIVKNCIARG